MEPLPSNATLQLVEARFATDVAAPAGVCCCVSLVVESAPNAPPPERFRQPPLRLAVDGGPELCAALREALFSRAACAYVEVAGTRHWSQLDRLPVAATDAPMPRDSDAGVVGRMLADYPLAARLNSFDVDVATLAKYLPPDGRSLTLHLVLPPLAPQAERARAGALARLSRDNLISDGLAPAVQPQVTILLPAVVAALAGLARRPAHAWLYDRRGWSLAAGHEVRVTLDEHALAGFGMHACADVMAQVLGRCAGGDGFIELVLLSADTGEELLRCPPRSGDALVARAVD